MIAAAGLGELVVRAVVSLAVVLTIVAVAYFVARRRAGAVAPVSARGAERGRRGRRRNTPPAIEVVGRVGLTRSTAAVAVRFGDRIVLIAASEQGPSNVISEMTAEEWDELRTVREPISPLSAAGSATTSIVEHPPSFLEALRQATARRHG